jgi:hypothetical protein
VLIAAAGGLLALAIGELTRRRGYDFVAKGVTALGFAILYATVFAAHRWYGLLGSAPAYGLATAITTAAMFYAVVLDEVIVAVLSLAGHTPVAVRVRTCRLCCSATSDSRQRQYVRTGAVGFRQHHRLSSASAVHGWWLFPADHGVTQLASRILLSVFFFVYSRALLHTLVRRVQGARHRLAPNGVVPSTWPPR